MTPSPDDVREVLSAMRSDGWHYAAELICRLRTIADRLTGEDAVEKLAEQIDGYFDGPPAFLREAASAILTYLTEGVKPCQ